MTAFLEQFCTQTATVWHGECTAQFFDDCGTGSYAHTVAIQNQHHHIAWLPAEHFAHCGGNHHLTFWAKANVFGNRRMNAHGIILVPALGSIPNVRTRQDFRSRDWVMMLTSSPTGIWFAVRVGTGEGFGSRVLPRRKSKSRCASRVGVWENQ